ncbi:hypothetical protein [Namhaeicola litoreus]|uniref:Outer membrane protein beta-barrel domain-containing protein n=1 Tax=Namhaeicola litoreus TaxID=1052145 RepID=A0ABW3Y854_9FLAO
MKPSFILFLVITFVHLHIFAQEKITDTIMLRNGKIILGKVKEIADEEIKYAQDGLREDITIGIDKAKVDKIIFADGREYDIDNSMSVYEDLSTQRKNILKFNLFLPIAGAVEFGYERSLKPGNSLEGNIGFIYGNNSTDQDASGVFLKVGYKFIRSPDFYLKGMKYAHILKGSYIKPEIAFTSFSYDIKNYGYGNNSGSTTNFAGLINFGKQVVYNNRISIDYYLGVGYATGDLDEADYYYAFLGGATSSFVMTGGIRVGYLF